jgi:DNA adenine methylase
LSGVQKENFIYLGPPYAPVSITFFRADHAAGFGKENQIQLIDFCDELTYRGDQFLLSSSDTSFIRELYKDYRVDTVHAPRSINCAGIG